MACLGFMMVLSITEKLPSEYWIHKNLRFAVHLIYDTGGPILDKESYSTSLEFLVTLFKLNFCKKLSWNGISLINCKLAK